MKDIYIYIYLNTNKTVIKPPSCHVSKICNSVYFDPTRESSSASTNERYIYIYIFHMVPTKVREL